MQINTFTSQCSVPNFKGAVKDKIQENSDNQGLAVASFMVPGAGQIVKGETKKGITHFLSATALASAWILSKKSNNHFIKSCTGVFGHLTTGVCLFSAFDAYTSKNKVNKNASS